MVRLLDVVRCNKSPVLMNPWFSLIGLGKNERLLSTNPKDPERESHPCVNLHQENKARLLLNRVRPRSVSCTSNKLTRTCDFRKCTKHVLMLTSSLPSLHQNQSLETILICNVALCFPHKNIACIHMCDECKISFDSGVCRKHLSISSTHEQVCSQTTQISGLPKRAK